MRSFRKVLIAFFPPINNTFVHWIIKRKQRYKIQIEGYNLPLFGFRDSRITKLSTDPDSKKIRIISYQAFYPYLTKK